MMTTAEAKSVHITDLAKTYPGGVTALQGLSLDVEKGEFVSLLGPSGCGKTTTLKIIAGLEQATSGMVHVGQQDIGAVPMNKRRMGVVFQNYALFPHMNVYKNLEFGLRMHGVPRSDRPTMIREALSMVGLEGKESRLPRQLSGGQQQRVALARAIVIAPDVLLLDESLAALDKRLRQRMQRELKTLQQKLGLTTIFVTHDQEEALTMSDRVVVMNEGCVSQVGTPQDVYRRPSNRFVLEFLGAVNTLHGRVIRTDERLTVQLDDGEGELVVRGPEFPVGTKVLVAARPEDLRLGSPNDPVPDEYTSLVARRTGTSFAGSRVRHYLTSKAGTGLMVDISGGERQGTSDQEQRVWWPKASIVLDQEGGGSRDGLD